jgi:hypothetical protein
MLGCQFIVVLAFRRKFSPRLNYLLQSDLRPAIAGVPVNPPVVGIEAEAVGTCVRQRKVERLNRVITLHHPESVGFGLKADRNRLVISMSADGHIGFTEGGAVDALEGIGNLFGGRVVR